MPVGDILRFQFTYEVNGQSCSNVMHSRIVADPVDIDVTNSAAQAFDDTFVTDFKKLMSDEAVVCNVKVHAVDSFLPPTLLLLGVGGGDIVGPSLPANKNIKFLLRQSMLSARTNGEIRLSGVPEADCDGNSYTGAATHAATIAGIISLLTNTWPNVPGDLIFSEGTRYIGPGVGKQ